MAQLETIEEKGRLALSGKLMIIACLGMLVFALHACTHMVAAGDTWVAMACGRHFANHGVDTVEPFSANSHKPGPTAEEIEKWPGWAQWITDKVGIETVKKWHPTGWVDQNWLTHWIFYSLVPKSSYADGLSFTSNAMVYWKFAIYIIAIACIFYTGVLLGVNPALSAVFSCFALFIGRSFIDIRPAGFSNMLVAVFILILALTTYRNYLYIWLIVPVTVFWCNVHGGYIYVFIMLVPFVGLNAVTAFSRKRFVSIGFKGIKHTIGAGIVAFVLMVLLNPFHLTNLTHTFVISVSEHAARWRDIHEWHPAFNWSNPVGTAVPFLVLLMLGLGLTYLWFLSRFLRPRFLKAPKNHLEAQRSFYRILSAFFGYSVAVVIFWVVFTCLSFLNLSIGDFFISALFVGIVFISAHKNVHFVYLTIPVVLLACWSASVEPTFMPGYAGRYIYPFCLLPTYVIVRFFTQTLSKKDNDGPLDIIFVAGTAIVGVILLVVAFNPFGFEQPFWHFKQFLDLKRMWRPAYGTELIGSDRYLFGILYAANMMAVSMWFLIPYLRDFFGRRDEADEQVQTSVYEPPRIDLAMITIAALTMYMAIRSRRFIPIAAIAACPVVSMFINQIVRTASASRCFHELNRLSVRRMTPNVQQFLVVAGAASVLFFGIWWGLKFKRVYLDPWPADPSYKLSNVFMRMTASDAKPFYAMRFIKDNKLSGKMLNYWTEGGFIAWGQEPDAKTGKTPLQLFMDGRAQAAYNRATFDTWTYTMAGGPAMQEVYVRRRSATQADYKAAGAWIGEQLRKHNVWIALMPAAQFDNNFVQSIEQNPEWRVVFLNNKQKIFVDYESPKGKALFDGILSGQTVYPDKFCELLTKGHLLLTHGVTIEDKKKGLDYQIEAFNEMHSPAPILDAILIAARYVELRARVTGLCRAWYEDFAKNKDKYATQNGYRLRLEAARLSCIHLQKIAQVQLQTVRARRDEAGIKESTELYNTYTHNIRQFVNERNMISMSKRW